ncbi:MAG TPA: choline dehydrogenase [Stellaceae bacterium]|nr:choline dehydrogenase [Stellaceae bacterium]
MATDRPDGSFDYIVAGAGSAGCAVAARLSESGQYRVLLLEAGEEDRNPWIHVPLGGARLFSNPRLSWLYDSETEPNLRDRVLYQPRGKVLGGSSSINGMVYIRGNATDYDGWRQRGCEGWGYDDVLSYFKKSEHQERGADAFHGVGGPLWVSDQRVKHELADAFVAAAQQLGIPHNPDFNGAQQEGVGHFQTTTRNGRRWSTATAYLRPARGRKNLTIETRALATRVLIEGGRAVGIEFRGPAGLRTVRARAEVIICGGTFNSPQLLQLSGIGPGDLLQRHGIPVMRDLPGVGANLQDHLAVGMVFKCRSPITFNDLTAGAWRRAALLLRYGLFRTGPLASNGVYACAFHRTDQRLDRPDIQSVLLPWSTLERTKSGLKMHPFSAFSIFAVHIHPDSRGWVRLKSPDPAAAPAIRFNFLGTEQDRRTIVAGMKLSRQIAHAPPLGAEVLEEFQPGAACASDAQLLDYCRDRAISLYHPVGTCRMGRDPTSVVDPRLRVIGVERLRVIDASVMPEIISGNTNAPTIMIGEKGAAMILQDAHAH